MDNFRSRFPFYKDDADYTTNAPSYYDDLARKNKLIQHLAEKIYDYDTILKTSLEEIEQILEQVIDKIGEGFNAEIADLLILWVEDGTLDHIINETLMNKKADKTELEALETALNNAMALLETNLSDQMTSLETQTNQQMNQLETDTTNKINDVQTRMTELSDELINRMNYTFHSGNMTLYNMQKRKQVDEKSYVSVQGSCYIEGSGNTMRYAMAFLPTDSNPNNKGTVVTTSGNNLIAESSGNIYDLHHANGMDYNPETNSIYVAHGNQVTSSGVIPNNQVTELSKSGQTYLRTITPKGIPAGRRVKYFSYDKVTNKKYLGDDLGIYEVDNELNVLKIINFSEEFLNYKSWGLGQTATIHNDLIFYLTMGPPTIAVFDIQGELLFLNEIPKFTSEGVFVGQEPQSLFFDNEDNLYMVSRTDYLDYRFENFYTRIFKMSPFTGTSSDNFIGTHNTNTSNTIYVTADPTTPIVTGSSSYPFHSLDDAINYVLTADSQKRFETNIILEDGNYGRSDIRTNGAKLRISGRNYDSYFDALRFYNTDVVLEGIHLNNPHHDYLLLADNSNIVLNGVRMNGQGKNACIYADNGSFITGTNLRENSIRNSTIGIYANASIVLGTIFTLGLTEHNNPVELSSSGFAPFLTTGG